MAARPILGLLALFFLAGAWLLQIIVILGGTTTGRPENLFYFLETTTNGIPGARNPSRWTLWKICGVNDAGHNANCGASVPALPFNPPGRSNFDTSVGVPSAFTDHPHKYYYMSRFAFAFFLISLVFGAIALFTGLLALCTRLGAYMSAMSTFVAAFFQILYAALMTAWSVEGRNHFRNAGQRAKIGTYAYAFSWTAVACYFICTVLFCLGGSAGRDKSATSTPRTRRSFFRRSRSTRSRHSQRGSFIDSERGGGIKDEY